MSNPLSAAVISKETDLTSIVPSVATSNAATVGDFVWGPVESVQLISNEDELKDLFGKPTDRNYKDFMSAANFLAYSNGLRLVRVVDDATAKNATASKTAGLTGQLIKNADTYLTTTFSSALFAAKYPGDLGNSLTVAFADNTGYNAVNSSGAPVWPYTKLFSSAPATNEFHIVVIDADGKISGTAGTVLETFEYVSSVTTAKSFDGSSSYAKTKIANSSQWIYIGNMSLLTGVSAGVTLAGGTIGSAITESDRIRGFQLFTDKEQQDISIVFASGGAATVNKWIIDNIAEVRKDSVACVSPLESDVVGQATTTAALTATKSTRTGYGSSSYAFMDSAYKLQYDRYNDTNRWVPLNGDIAGLFARTDSEFDPWFSPAGVNRGRIKNVIRFSVPQNQAYRDELYKVGINPVTVFPNEGPVLYGDKTLLTRPSAFNFVNVRRLFLTIEKQIEAVSKYLLFEQNDDYSRRTFKNTVEPFLRDVQGRRGIEDFRVVCDASNNTAEVINRGEFVGTIYVKPIKSIQWITLNFVAVRSGVSFDEIVQTDSNLG